MSRDNSTGKDKEFYERGKRIFDRLNPPGTIRPEPLPDWKAECPHCKDYKSMYLKVRDELAAEQQITQRQTEVPAGYTAEELERDNPYNQWMGENT